jgi:hypothetical protein
MESLPEKLILTEQQAHSTGLPAEIDIAPESLFDIRQKMGHTDAEIGDLISDGHCDNPDNIRRAEVLKIQQGERTRVASALAIQLGFKSFQEYIDSLPSSEA